MRISHNISAMNTYRQYNANAASANKSMEKLSSGSRINRAADDAAGLSISEKMRSQIRGLTQGTRNAQDGVSFIQTAEGALNEVSDMLTRLKELAVQVQNGSYSNDDKANIGAEMNALGTAITEIYVNTKFNGSAVFGSQSGTTVLANNDGTGNAASIAYGENATQTITIKAAKTTALNLLTVETADATTGADAAAKAANAAAVSVTLVENAITEVNTTRAAYGAQQNQLEHASNNMATTKENLQAAESRVRDVDMAEEMMTYTKNNILLQAAQSMLAQANSQPQGVLQLLQ
ncbi:MAG: flagellin [Clostridiales bacterium GWF2_36_10]|nr:MAG: flagellin [Clostridiales bacterium GWF2_36_10]HAN20832.1 flagellin [Clostridiales bacterium]